MSKPAFCMYSRMLVAIIDTLPSRRLIQLDMVQCEVVNSWSMLHRLDYRCLFATRLRSAAFVIVTIDSYLLDVLASKGILSLCVILFKLWNQLLVNKNIE